VFDSLDPGIKRNYRPEHLIGAEVLLTDVSLTEVLASRAVRLVGQVGDSKEPLWQLALDSLSSHQGFDMKLVVDLDAHHDFLPRRIELTESVPEGSQAKYGGWRMEWQVDEFTEVEDCATGAMRWFPKRARLVQQEGENAPTFLVEHIAINAEVPESTFDPAVGPGAQVMDNTSEGNGRVFFVGDGQTMDRRISQIAELAQAQNARPRRASPSRAVLLWVGFALLVVVLMWVVWRRRSGASHDARLR
jgi:hypothetical protein